MFPFLQIFSVRLTYLDRRRECVAGNLAHCDHQCTLFCDHQCTVYFIFCPLCTLFCVHCDHQCTLFCAQWATELQRTLSYIDLCSNSYRCALGDPIVTNHQHVSVTTATRWSSRYVFPLLLPSVNCSGQICTFRLDDIVLV